VLDGVSLTLPKYTNDVKFTLFIKNNKIIKFKNLIVEELYAFKKSFKKCLFLSKEFEK